LLKNVAAGAYSVADGRLWKYDGSFEKSCPISFEPTTLPSRSIIEPSARPGNATWLTPVMRSGYARPSTSVKATTAIAAVLSSRMSVELVG
jgi:hypothetical protein